MTAALSGTSAGRIAQTIARRSAAAMRRLRDGVLILVGTIIDAGDRRILASFVSCPIGKKLAFIDINVNIQTYQSILEAIAVRRVLVR